MIEVFQVMAFNGGGDARAMAGGVSKATLPTMAGMVAALSGSFAAIYLTPGEKIISTMAMGQSAPWQDAFEKLTGSRNISGKSVMNYYKPLKDWLDIQNKIDILKQNKFEYNIKNTFRSVGTRLSHYIYKK